VAKAAGRAPSRSLPLSAVQPRSGSVPVAAGRLVSVRRGCFLTSTRSCTAGAGHPAVRPAGRRIVQSILETRRLRVKMPMDLVPGTLRR
jgi:hypothetical protein